MSEPREIRLRRLHMRSIRRGIKEMDVILQAYSEAHLAELGPADLDRYEALLSENDQDLYRWVSGQDEAPSDHMEIVADIRAHLAKSVQF